MYCVSVNLTSAEWLEIQQAASEQWPSENLSRAEVVRRYALLGIQFPKYVSPRDIVRATERLQASQIAYYRGAAEALAAQPIAAPSQKSILDLNQTMAGNFGARRSGRVHLFLGAISCLLRHYNVVREWIASKGGTQKWQVQRG